MSRIARFSAVLVLMVIPSWVFTQEENIRAYELSVDQDNFADFLHDDPEEPYNYTVGLRLGIYGEWANHVYLGLPWVREKIDGFLIDWMQFNTQMRYEDISHNFVLTINGFSPAFISDETPLFMDTLAAGYQLERDLPFASFTGFRSSRRLELSRYIAHRGGQFDMAVTSSLTLGFASLGMAKGMENLLGGNRPKGVLWERDENKPYPTGQLNHAMAPMVMYSLSVEAVVFRPVRKVLLQLRPEINLGYYTDIGIGFDFGKVMNSERFIDNLSYTDTHNPGLVSINTEDVSFSLVAGGMARAVLYNAHYHGMFGWNKREEWAFEDTETLLLEGYVGLKLQFYKKVELNFSINTRSPVLKHQDQDYYTWGTIGFKYLVGSEGEGCYD